MYNEFMEALTPTLTNALIGVLIAASGLVVAFLNKKRQEVEQKMTTEEGKKYATMINNTVVDCVKSVTQTYVDTLKSQDCFTEEKQAIAFNKSMNSIKTILKEDAIDYISTISNDVEAYLTSKIESTIDDQKNDKSKKLN